MRRGVIHGAAPGPPPGRRRLRRKPRRIPRIMSDLLTPGMSYKGVGHPDAPSPALADQAAQGAEAEALEPCENLVLQVRLDSVDDTVDLVVDGPDLFGRRLDADDTFHLHQSVQPVHCFNLEIFDELVRRRNGIEQFDEVDLRLDRFGGDRLGSLDVQAECLEVGAGLAENSVDNLFHDGFSF